MHPRDHKVRFSNLKRISQSAAHYRAALETERGDTPAMRLGRLVHAIVLGGNYVVYDGDRRGNAWKSFKAENDGTDIVTAKEIDGARRIADSVLSCGLAAELLTGGETERQLTWTWIGRECRGTIDLVDKRRVVELKTCADAHPDRFQRTALRMGYHAQLAWYRNGGAIAGLCAASSDCYVVAVETKHPYPVVVHRLAERLLDDGERLCRMWLEQLLNCEHSDYWPGYVDYVVPFDRPEMDDDFTLTIDGEEVAA
jgi:hypothetical protein